MMITIFFGRLKFSRQEYLYSIVGGQFGFDDVRIYSGSAKIFYGTKTHSAADYRVAIMQGINQTGMTMSVVLMIVSVVMMMAVFVAFRVTLSEGVRGIAIFPNFLLNNLTLVGMEYDKAGASPEMPGDRNSIR